LWSLSNKACSFCIGETQNNNARRLFGPVEVAVRDTARHAHQIAGTGIEIGRAPL